MDQNNKCLGVIIMTLDERVVKVLQKIGWHVDHQIEPSHWIKVLEQEGYKCFPIAREFLTVFGGLVVKPDKEIMLHAIHPVFPFNINPLDAASGEHDRMEIWEPIIGKPVFPIGQAYDAAILLISNDGYVYACERQTVDIVGESINEAFQVLIFGSKHRIRLNPK